MFIDFPGELRTLAPLDRERVPAYSLTARATDGGGLFCQSHIQLTLEDVNDNPPLFSSNHYHTCVYENTATKALLTRVQALDPDLGKWTTSLQVPNSDPQEQESLCIVRAGGDSEIWGAMPRASFPLPLALGYLFLPSENPFLTCLFLRQFRCCGVSGTVQFLLQRIENRLPSFGRSVVPSTTHSSTRGGQTDPRQLQLPCGFMSFLIS